MNNKVTKEMPLIEALKIIEKSKSKIAVVVSETNEVIGTITDGDIRRYLLNDNSLQNTSEYAMNKNPIITEMKSENELITLLNKKSIKAIPIIDDKRKYLKTFFIDEEKFSKDKENFSSAVIMAGGEGQRLRPLTQNTPKPMIEIGGISILERQIKHIKSINIHKIFISINYLGNIIKQYFGNGDKFGVNITYIEESKKLGTAGGLSLIQEKNRFGDILVINGDILTQTNYLSLYNFHKETKSSLTVGVVPQHFQIPYGVIKCKKNKITQIIEKPSERYLCNAGIYAISHNVIKNIKKNKFYLMTDLINECIEKKSNVSAYIIHEFWLDIATVSDLEKAKSIESL